MFPSLRAGARRPSRRLLGLPLAAALVVGTLAAAPTTTATAASAVSTVSTASAASVLTAAPAAAEKKKKKPKGWKPRSGPIFNAATGKLEAKYRIHNQIQTAIYRARKGSTIKIMSWNIMSRAATNALLTAQRNGVRVQALMDASNSSADVPNPEWRRLRFGLAAYNQAKKLKPAKRSFAKTCRASCRGARGQAHAKFYLFSHTGTAKKVVMQGSANFTQAASTNQWNDLYTTIGNKPLYRFAERIYGQMWKDKPVAAAFAQIRTRDIHFYFSPFTGPNYKTDPYQQLLRQVRCTGAEGGAGNANGRTVIRVAPDVMRNERGMRAAQSLKYLWDRGCDVKIGYTVMGVSIFRFLKQNTGRGPVPIRHLVQDFDGDKDFDNYFHLKAMSINGVVGTDTTAYFTVNGSANLSGAASVSDENIAIINKRGVTRRYQKHIDFWFENFPSDAPAQPMVGGDAARRLGFDPYVHVDMD